MRSVSASAALVSAMSITIKKMSPIAMVFLFDFWNKGVCFRNSASTGPCAIKTVHDLGCS